MTTTPEITEPLDVAAEPTPAPRRKLSLPRFRRSTLILTGIAVLGWAAFGGALAGFIDQTGALGDSQVALASEQDHSTDLQTRLDSVTDARDELLADVSRVEAREVAVSTKESDLNTREAAIKATEQHIQETSLKDGYVYTVGISMEAGTYQTTATNSSCYWKITRSGSNYSDIVDNDYGSVGVLTVSVSGGQDFASSDCGTWTKVG